MINLGYTDINNIQTLPVHFKIRLVTRNTSYHNSFKESYLWMTCTWLGFDFPWIPGTLSYLTGRNLILGRKINFSGNFLLPHSVVRVNDVLEIVCDGKGMRFLWILHGNGWHLLAILLSIELFKVILKKEKASGIK